MNRNVERFFWYILLEEAHDHLIHAINTRKVQWTIDEDLLDFSPMIPSVKGKVDIEACIIDAKHRISTESLLTPYRMNYIVDVVNAANYLSGQYKIELLTENVRVIDLIAKAKEKVLKGRPKIF